MTLSYLSRVARWARRAALVGVVAAFGCVHQMERQQARYTYAAIDMAAYSARAPVITHPLTLSDALDYASRYNIDVWIAAHERKYQHEIATQSLLKMLPSLIFGAESSRRSKFNASSSESLKTREQSLEPSFSSEKQTDRWDVQAVWNLLDFGISFLRARQQENRVSIAMERERRIQQNLALEVTGAYWRAVAARESAMEAARVLQKLEGMLETVRRETEEKTLSQFDGLKREITLLDQLEQLQRYRHAHLAATTALASLIGLPVGAPITLADVDLDEPVVLFLIDVEALETEALRSRPELFERDLEEAISRDEVRVALAEMFPSVSLFWRRDEDRNKFLSFEQWSSAGLRASWNLLAIPHQIKYREAVKLQTELVKKRRTAIAVAILTQLHLSLIGYAEAADRREIVQTIATKNRALLNALQTAVNNGRSHQGELFDQRLKYLRTRARYLGAHVNLMLSGARLLNTVGRDPERADPAVPTEETTSPEAAPAPADGQPTLERTEDQ